MILGRMPLLALLLEEAVPAAPLTFDEAKSAFDSPKTHAAFQDFYARRMK